MCVTAADGLHTVAFASRFLNSVEDRYSFNELELLGEIWSTEHFKDYLYGKPFTVITDHRALLYLMKEKRANKSYNSRLTRWVDRLLHFDFSTPSKVRFADEACPSTAPSAPVTPSAPGTDTTTVTTSSSDNLYTDAFNFALSEILSSTLMDSLKSKDAILTEVRDCVITENEDRCRQIRPYIHSFWMDLHVKHRCLCVDDLIAIPNSIKDAYVEAIHATHRGSWEMTDMVVHAWWSFMHRDLLSKTARCDPCVKISKNLKSVIPSSKWAALKLCKVLNDENQIEFGGPIHNKKSRSLFSGMYGLIL